jgi:hypothetical protein
VNGSVSSTRIRLDGRRITTTGLALVSSGLGRVSTSPSHYTVGNAFALTASARLIGVKFTHKLASEGTPESVKAKAYDSSGTLLGSVTTPITASGEYSVLFPASYAIPAWTSFKVAVYNTTGAYVKWTLAGVTTVRIPDFQTAYNGGFGVPFGAGVVYMDGFFDIGDVVPTSRQNPSTGPQVFAVDPVLDYD